MPNYKGRVILVGDRCNTPDAGVTSKIITDGEHFGYEYTVYHKNTWHTYRELTPELAATMEVVE